MSFIVKASNTFYDICSLLAKGIKTITDSGNYVLQLNYNLVATVISILHTLVSAVVTYTLQIWNIVQNIAEYVLDFVLEIHHLIISVACFIQGGFAGVYYFVVWGLVTGVNLFISCAQYITDMFSTMWETAVYVYEGTSYFFHLIFDGIVLSISSVFHFFTSLGNSCIYFVTGIWFCLGFALSSIARFPIYCIESVEAARDKAINFVVHAVTFAPKETYLGIICLCLLYFMLSNIFRYLSCHGMPLFSSQMRSRNRRGQNLDWHVDRGFESDFEDLYNSDTEDRVWRNNTNQTVSVDSDDESSGGSESESDEDDSNDSETVDNDISDDDDDADSDDERTVVTEESDSDASLNSQTFSTESSDHEIDIQLPSREERYSLRSRSSTPCHYINALNSPEQFDREMERERDKRKCVVCQDNIKSVLVMPCRHMCMCVDCADHIVRSRFIGRRVCPLCRTQIQKVMNVYV